LSCIYAFRLPAEINVFALGKKIIFYAATLVLSESSGGKRAIEVATETI
jgi:hypothetical protein